MEYVHPGLTSYNAANFVVFRWLFMWFLPIKIYTQLFPPIDKHFILRYE